MKKKLGQAPLPIGGWLILAAVQLMWIFDEPVFTLESMLCNSIINGSGEIIPIQSILLGFSCMLLPAYCVLLFFQKKKRFIHFYIALMVLFMVLYVVLNIIYAPDNGGFILLYNYKEVLIIALGIGITIYMFRSSRVKRTFVFGMKEKVHRDGTPPLQIYGWLIVIAYDIAVRISWGFMIAVNRFTQAFTNPGYGTPPSLRILDGFFYLFILIFSIYNALLFFRRKRAFKLFYILLMAFMLMPDILFLIRGEIVNFISVGIYFAYAIAASIYLFLSQRAENTFVFDAYEVPDQHANEVKP
jgi:hypothetical protein